MLMIAKSLVRIVVTLSLTGVVIFLAITGTITADQIIALYGPLIGFWFGQRQSNGTA